MNIKSLRLFRQIVMQGSLSAAATQLHISQPAASRLLSILEGELRMKLFDRAGRSLVLTDHGEVFFREAEHIIAGMDEIPRIATDIRNRRHQPLRVLTAPRIGQGLVAAALTEMRASHPDLAIVVDVRSRMALEKQLGIGSYDLGIISLPVAHSLLELVASPLVKVRAEALMAAGHPLAAQPRITAQDLSEYPLLVLSRSQIWRQEIDNFMREGGVKAHYAVQSSSSLLACQMARDGAGICILDRLCAPSIDLRGAVLRPLEPARWAAFGYVHAKGSGPSEVAQELIACMRQIITDVRHTSPDNAAAIQLAELSDVQTKSARNNAAHTI